jgi:hypothetical protein
MLAALTPIRRCQTLSGHVWPLPQQIPAAQIARIFRTSNPLPNYPARYNTAPTR